ncbi:hypothetical protein AAFC00_002162 [Neodothiora populina]|uniref:Short chain alcohol dehydrogenase n=1 Tax=Neodothiora populina TaxID=2781224 RepID=A0ABR3PGH1_9PEZI
MAKSALISGGARGIGRCLVRRFCELGYRVYIFDIDQEELDHTVHSHLKQYFEAGTLSSSLCNLRDVEDIRKQVVQAAEFLNGRVDVLVNNGGIAAPRWKDGKMMDNMDTLVEWQAYIETNLTAPFVVSQACLPYMRHDQSSASSTSASDAGPCIIHVGSFRALQSDPNQEGYASTKAGLIGLTHSMAISLAHLGIRVNLIAPGRIKVAHECKVGDEQGTGWEEQNEDKDVGDLPTNRAGRPRDIADAAEYLANAGFVTGQDLTVDGGATRKKS